MVSIKLFVLCLGFFAINIKKSQAVTDQEKKDVLAVLTPVIVDCSAEHDVSDELLKGLKKSGDYKDVDPCFLACILKKVKLFDGEGKYDVAKAKEVNTKFVSSEDDKKKIEEVIDECSSVNDKDVSDGDKGCERAALLFECMLPHKELAVYTLCHSGSGTATAAVPLHYSSLHFFGPLHMAAVHGDTVPLPLQRRSSGKVFCDTREQEFRHEEIQQAM